MSSSNAEEPEYESDPEELKQSLARRRREASESDDDDDDEEVTNRRVAIDSDQSDGEGSYEEEEGAEFREHGIENDNTVNASEDTAEEEKEKKQSTVPTGGAFYMHDDRFQEFSGGRSRGRRGGRPWGSGDERKWGHDKFEEVNTQEKHYDQRASRSRFRGRGTGIGRGRGQERGYTRGSSSNASTSRGQQIYLPKDVTRGRGGPRKYDTPLGNVNQAHSVLSKQ